jgi:hypothetical protein
LAVIVAAVVISTRRPVAIAEVDAAQAAIAPPAPTAPGAAVEERVQVERDPVDVGRINAEQAEANPTNSGRH